MAENLCNVTIDNVYTENGTLKMAGTITFDKNDNFEYPLNDSIVLLGIAVNFNDGTTKNGVWGINSTVEAGKAYKVDEKIIIDGDNAVENIKSIEFKYEGKIVYTWEH
ncbi:MAG: hypothetical protein LBT66_02465 [Methanobrevibacter sp.]|jgi:hypothetical protein|nr:hypothetical protein [Candidatus Methanovirga meridionalis]